jgi:hypothetical protein
MTHVANLDELERDVERARARLSGNLARLRDPATISHAKADLMAQAHDYRHRLVESVGGAANERAQNLGDILRQRAQENPAALAAIGAGVLWRLWKRPPVATLLVGAGLASLLAGRGEEGRAPAEGLLGRVQEVNRATHALGGRAAELAERARHAAADLADQARVMAEETVETMSHASDRKPLALLDLDGDGGDVIRDNPLAFGVAAVAIGAALGLALRREA